MTTPPSAPELIRMLARAIGTPYLPLAFVGRLPFAMMIVGVLTVTTIEQGSLTLAGLLAACAGIGTASLGPASGAMADRIGQRRVLLMLAIASSIAAISFLLLVQLELPPAALVVSAVLLGATTPQVAPFSRARLVGVVSTLPEADGSRARSIVMSYESMADEASFVLGPVLVGLLSVGIAPWAPLALSAVVTLTVVTTFALHPTAHLVPSGHAGQGDGLREPLRTLMTSELAVLVLAMITVGGIFGSLLTGLTALLQERGAVEQTGLLYGSMSVGAIVMAIAMAVLPARVSLQQRWLAGSALAFLAVSSLLREEHGLLVIVLFVAGCGVGASLVTLFSLGAIAAPADRTNTVLVTLQSSLVVGQAATTALSGFLAELVGPNAVLGMAAVLTVALLLLAIAHRIVKRPVDTNEGRRRSPRGTARA